MKKLSAVLFAGLFVLALAGAAKADHQVWSGEPNYAFSVGGQFEIDGFYWDGPAKNDDDKSWYNQETRVFFKGAWGDVTGLLRLEFDYDWDQSAQNKGNTTQNALDLAYIAFPLPYTPIKMSAGLQPILFGNSIYLDDSLYMLTAGYKTDAFGLTLLTGKVKETYEAKDDVDLYGAVFSTKAAETTIQALFTYINAPDDFNPMTLGVFAKGAAAGINFWGEGYYQMGSLSKDVDLAAYALAIGAGAPVGPAEISGWFVYGSGDDDGGDDEVNAFQPLLPYFKPDLIVVDNLNGSSISNVWAVALKAQMVPVENLKVWAQAGYYNLVEAEDDSNIGTEIDLGAIYTINKYMTWKVTAATLLVGDAFGDDADNIIELNNEFMVNF